MQKVKLPLSKTSYVGLVVLEFSILHMLKYAYPTITPLHVIDYTYSLVMFTIYAL